MLRRRSGSTVLRPTLTLPVAFPAHRRSTLAGALILFCRTPCPTGRPRSFVLGLHGGEVRRPCGSARDRARYRQLKVENFDVLEASSVHYWSVTVEQHLAPDYIDAMFNLALLLQRKSAYAEAADY